MTKDYQSNLTWRTLIIGEIYLYHKLVDIAEMKKAVVKLTYIDNTKQEVHLIDMSKKYTEAPVYIEPFDAISRRLSGPLMEKHINDFSDIDKLYEPMETRVKPTDEDKVPHEIITYELVESDKTEYLNYKINEKLKAGWELYGSPVTNSQQVGSNSYQRFLVAQAMIKKGV